MRRIRSRDVRPLKPQQLRTRPLSKRAIKDGPVKYHDHHSFAWGVSPGVKPIRITRTSNQQIGVYWARRLSNPIRNIPPSVGLGVLCVSNLPPANQTNYRIAAAAAGALWQRWNWAGTGRRRCGSGGVRVVSAWARFGSHLPRSSQVPGAEIQVHTAFCPVRQRHGCCRLAGGGETGTTCNQQRGSKPRSARKHCAVVVISCAHRHGQTGLREIAISNDSQAANVGMAMSK